MSDITSTSPEPAASSHRLSRGRKITIATLVTAGIATGGIFAAEGSFASGGGSSTPAGGTASAPANAPKPAAAPSANDLDGTVTAASSDSITVRGDFGTSRTFAITSDTAVHNGRTKSSAGALEVGQHVHVRASKSGSTYTAKDIDVRAAHIGGTVKSISGDSVTVTDHDGFTRTIALSSSTTFTKDGATSSRSALTGTSVINAEGKVASDGTTLDATSVDILTKAPAGPAGGPMGGPAGGPGKGAPPAPGKGGGKHAAPSGAPKAPSGAPKAPSGAPKAPSGAPKAPAGAPSGGSSAAPSGGASSGS